MSEATEFSSQTDKSDNHVDNTKGSVKAEEPLDSMPANSGVNIEKHAWLHPSSMPYAQTE